MPIWVRLVGDASVLQRVDGVRAREAIVRITDASSGVEKISQVEVYAEGDVRLSAGPNSALPAYRGTFRTTEVQLKCYDAGGPKTVNGPPWDLCDHSPVGFSGTSAGRGRSNGRERRAGARAALVETLCHPWFRRWRRPPVPGRSCRRKPSRLLPWQRPRAGKPLPRARPAIVRWNRAQARPGGPACRARG